MIFVMDLTPSSMGIQPDPTMQPFKARGHEVMGGGSAHPRYYFTALCLLYCTQCSVQ